MLPGEFPVFAPEAQGQSEYLAMGSGWGALEQRRRGLRGLPPLPLGFPESSIGDDEQPWLHLLLHGSLPDGTSSFMTGPDWRAMLERSNGKEALVHLGVMLYEDGPESGAIAAWEKSLPHPLAYRCLSLAAAKNGDAAKALRLMEKAFALDSSDAYKREYAELLLQAGEYDRCRVLLDTLPQDAPDRLWLLRAVAARHTGRWDALEAMLAREYACVREGETTLTDLWFAWAEATGQPNRTDPPPHLDFRMQ
jgi:tetratricopeptide (TPR) repeat protein